MARPEVSHKTQGSKFASRIAGAVMLVSAVGALGLETTRFHNNSDGLDSSAHATVISEGVKIEPVIATNSTETPTLEEEFRMSFDRLFAIAQKHHMIRNGTRDGSEGMFFFSDKQSRTTIAIEKSKNESDLNGPIESRTITLIEYSLNGRERKTNYDFTEGQPPKKYVTENNISSQTSTFSFTKDDDIIDVITGLDIFYSKLVGIQV